MTVDLTDWLWIKFWDVLVHFNFSLQELDCHECWESLLCNPDWIYPDCVHSPVRWDSGESLWELMHPGGSSHGSPGWCSANTAVLAVFLRDATGRPQLWLTSTGCRKWQSRTVEVVCLKPRHCSWHFSCFSCVLWCQIGRAYPQERENESSSEKGATAMNSSYAWWPLG